MATEERNQKSQKSRTPESPVATTPVEAGATGRGRPQGATPPRAPEDDDVVPASRKKRRFVPGGGGVDWRDLPEFCDKTAALSAATYGARRLPEIRALYRQSTPFGSGTTNINENDGVDDIGSARATAHPKMEEALRSGGCKTSNRHLRRRATSHLSRKRHRFPSGSFDAGGGALMGDGGSGDKRRDRPSAASVEGGPLDSDASSRRKRRRKRETICQGHESWKGTPPAASTSSSLIGAAAGPDQPEVGGKAQWIPTHLWHAKRFRVEAVFGWNIPVVHGNRGAKAALRLVLEGKTLVQDVTYACQPIRLDLTVQEQTSGADDHLPLVVREIRRVLPGFHFDPREKDSSKVVDGMLHHADSFPLRPIGPVQWIVATDPLSFREATDEQPLSGNKKVLYLYMLVHASIRGEAIECLQHWSALGQSSVSTAVLAHGVPGGMACLRLRGTNAVATLDSARAALGFGSLPNSNAKVVQSNHGKMHSFPSKDAAEPQGLGDACGVVHGVIHCPRDPELPCNWGSAGLDVWCHPRLASKLLVALVVHGGACPIGLVEQAHLALEAEPPVPVFPRDYVDTRAGMSYWTADASDWRLYRSCLEAGPGRVSVSDNGPVKFVNWPLMISSSETATAVVRGAFGLPFEQCFPTTDPEPSRQLSSRRRRRPTRSPDALVHVPPLPRERMAEHQVLCQALLNSLSLPTLILCHVLVSGRGTVSAGDTIFDFNSSPRSRRPLGRVTCGSFSPCRGAYHGLAVCGASRILETMLAARSFVRTDHALHPRGRTSKLAVRIGNVSPKLMGSLSFLF